MRKLSIILAALLLLTLPALAEGPYRYAEKWGVHFLSTHRDDQGVPRCFLIENDEFQQLSFTDDGFLHEARAATDDLLFNPSILRGLFLNLVNSYDWEVSYYWPNYSETDMNSRIAVSYGVTGGPAYTAADYADKDAYITALMVALGIGTKADAEGIPADAGSAPAGLDLSALSYADLLALRRQIDRALWACDEMQPVEVPSGTYTVGEDIPAGKWTVRLSDLNEYDISSVAVYRSAADYNGARGVLSNALLSPESPATLTLTDGQLISVDGSVTFAPFVGFSFPTP